MSIVARSLQNYQVAITAGAHDFVADEPAGIGDDAGPNPYDLLLAALASCKIITAQMYARRKEWPLEGVALSLKTYSIHAKDCEACATEDGDPNARIGIIEGTIRFAGPLTPQQRERLAEIADRCPVQRTLLGEIQVHISHDELEAEGSSTSE
jgi:putative redox protein